MGGAIRSGKRNTTRGERDNPVNIPKKSPNTPADQNADYDSLAAENRRLKELNADLHSQCVEMRKSKPMSPDEEKAVSDLRADYNKMKDEQDKIALWLRENRAEEIKKGKHTGLSFSEVVIMYLARGV